MKGYVQNTGAQAYFILQRQIPPSGKITLEDAYRVVGKRSGLKETQVLEFVEFLRTEVFKRGSWSFLQENGQPFEAVDSPQKNPDKKKSKKRKPTTARKGPVSGAKTSSKRETDARGAGRSMHRDVSESSSTEITPAAIIEAPYERARSLIEKTKDRAVLKKALGLTKHFARKEQHMRHILKRLEQVY